MDNETANYIYRFHQSLYTDKERRALIHYNVSLSYANADEQFGQRFELMKDKGLLSNDPEVLALLKDGHDAFLINTANRILAENNPDEILVKCPKCNGLLRTPYAQQCRHCFYSWHKPKMELVTIYISKRKMAKLILFCIVFIALGLWMLITQPTSGNALMNSPIVKYGAAILAVVFGLVGLVVCVPRLFGKIRSVLIDDEGIFYTSPLISYGYIYWKDILSYTTITVKKQKMIGVKVNNPETYLNTLVGRYTRITMKWNYNQYGTPLILTTNHLECSHDELLQVLKQRLEAYNRGKAKP